MTFVSLKMSTAHLIPTRPACSQFSGFDDVLVAARWRKVSSTPKPSGQASSDLIPSQRRFSEKPWYGKVLAGGWPDIKGEVRLGIPTTNRFGERVILYLSDSGNPQVLLLP